MLHKLVDGVQVPLTPEEIEEFNERERLHAIRTAEAAAKAYIRLRAENYPTIEELVVALVEKEEGRPEMLTALLAQRQRVKLLFPKEGEI